MTTSQAQAIRSDVNDSAFNDLIDELTARLQAGEPVDADAYIAAHPEHADALRRFVPALQVLADLSRSRDANGAAPPDLGDCESGTLGDFRIVREVGRGGMGVVYEAEQISLNRRVALKVLPLAATLDPRQLARFRHEAQAAAMLHHPHIVPVYGVGCERGVHFYAMQLIEGRSLAAVINEIRPGHSSGSTGSLRPSDSSGAAGASGHRAPTAPAAALSTKKSGPDRSHFRRVAELVAQAADALEYAHSMGVVHRDVKPANLLLDAAGHLWVTDFGLARLGDGANLTVSGDLLGTLRYMSPEQALAKHGLVDHRTDVYSLGATLYELLTLRPAVVGEDKQEVLRRIAFEEPAAPRKLDKATPAELETITLKALAKEPAERYATAGELAEDLRRWLSDQTIRAKPPTVGQRAAKWARRHRAIVGASLAALLLAVAGLALSTWLIWREKEKVRLAKDRAEHAERESRDHAAVALAVNEFLQADLLLQSGIWEQVGRNERPDSDIKVRTLLDRAAAKIGTRFRDQPVVAAALHHTVGQAYSGIGVYDSAIRHLTSALQSHTELLGRDHRDTAATLCELAAAYRKSGQPAQAIRLLEGFPQRRPDGAGIDEPARLVRLNMLGLALLEDGQADNAVRTLEPLCEQSDRLLGPDHPESLNRSSSLGNAYRLAGRLDESIRRFENLRERNAKLHGPDDFRTLFEEGNLAVAYHDAGRHRESATLFERVVAAKKRLIGPDYHGLAGDLNNLAGAYMETGRLEDAIRLIEAARPDQRALPTNQPETLVLLNTLAVAYQRAGRGADAIRLYERLLERMAPAMDSDYPHVLMAMSNLAEAYSSADRMPEAIQLYERTIQIHLNKFGPNHDRTLHVLHNLGGSYRKAGRLGDAIRVYEQAREGRRAVLGPDNAATLLTTGNLAFTLFDDRQFARAGEMYREIVDAQARRSPPDPMKVANTKHRLGECWVHAGKFSEAEGVLRESLTVSRQQRPGAWQTSATTSLLGAALLGQGRHTEAEPLLRQAFEGLHAQESKIPGRDRAYLTDTLERLVRLCDATKQPERAAEWRKRLERQKTEVEAPTAP